MTSAPQPRRGRGRPRKTPVPVVNGPTADYRAPMVDREAAAETEAPTTERVIIPITAGRIHWPEVRGEDKLRAAIAAEPDAAQRLGLVADKEAPAAEVVTAEHARALYAAVNDILQFTISRQTNFPRPELAHVIGYTEAEYEAMCPLTARILNRYLPARMAAYQDLMLLGVTLYEVHQRKFLQLREYIEGKVKQMEAARVAAGTVDGAAAA